MAASEPVRLGYVNWWPPDLVTRVSGIAQLHVDAGVMPSHTQAARVADGSIDLAICWVQTNDLATHNLQARLIGADRVYAISTGADTSAVQAKNTLVLVDADIITWESWNRYAEQFSGDTGARIVHIDDGGITGQAFFDHVRRLPIAILDLGPSMPPP
jgi:hypothetical protein